MGHGRLRPERRLSGFKMGSARQIQSSKHWHARARSERSGRRSGVHGFPSFTGVCSVSSWKLSSRMSAVTAQCELVLCATDGEELQFGVDLETLLCCATQPKPKSGIRKLCVEETPQQLSQVARDGAPAVEAKDQLELPCKLVFLLCLVYSSNTVSRSIATTSMADPSR